MLTLPAGICSVKLLKIGTSGRLGYLKLTCRKSMSPLTSSNVKPSLLPELIFDFRSNKANMDAVDSLAFLESEAKALVSDIPVVANNKAKKTCET